MHYCLSRKEMHQAYRSLIVVSSPNPDWNRIDPLLEDIRNISKAKYGVSQTVVQKVLSLYSLELNLGSPFPRGVCLLSDLLCS